MFRQRIKRRRVAEVIQQAISTREAGLEIDYDSLERNHADLMPQLGRQLRRLKHIQAAVRTARQKVSPQSPSRRANEPPGEDLRMLQEVLDGYQVLHRIQYGGQGVVYKAVQTTTKRPVALKILIDGPLASEHQRKRFAREVEFTGRLRHPNIVTIYESGVARGRPFFAMEYIQGLPVDQYVQSMGTGVRDIVRIMRDVCRAVSAAHQRGIIHRDLKPANILVDSAGVPHVLDFGLAKDITPDGDYSRVSMPGQVVGTLPYLSPEQVCGEDEVDVRSDIYTLGVVLYELLSAQSPYPPGEDRRVLRDQILHHRPVGLRKVLLQPVHHADDLEKILARTLEKDRALRYQSADALADDLQRYLDGDAIAAKDQNRMYLLKKTVRRFRIPIAITAVFIIILFAALVGVTAAWRRAETLSKLYKSGLEMGAYVKMASVARDEGRIDQAIKMFEQAIQLAVFDEREDPGNPLIMRHIYNAKYRLADLLMDLGRAKEAQVHVLAAVDIADSMLESSPDDDSWRLRHTFARLLSGKSAYAKDDFETARGEFQVAADAFAAFAQDDPDNLNHRLNQGYALGLLGKCHRTLSDHQAAQDCLVAAGTILQDLVARKPQNAEYLIELARIETRLGFLHFEQAQLDLAGELFRTAKQRLIELQASDQAAAMARESDALLAYINRKLSGLEASSAASLPAGP